MTTPTLDQIYSLIEQIPTIVFVALNSVLLLIKVSIVFKKEVLDRNAKKNTINQFLRRVKLVDEYFEELRQKLYPLKIRLLIFLFYTLGLISPTLTAYFFFVPQWNLAIITSLLSVYLMSTIIFLPLMVLLLVSLFYRSIRLIWSLKILGSLIWGMMTFVLILLLIVNINIIILPNTVDVGDYVLSVLIVLGILASVWLPYEYLVVKETEKRIKADFSDEIIGNLRRNEILVNIGANGTLVRGRLWDFDEKGVVLYQNGEILVFWDNIDWIEVIENEEQNNETSKKTKNKKESGWIDYLGFIVLSILIMLLAYFGNLLNFNNIDNERYVLSAIIQSEAAILAIVASLSLIAVQLTASSYSPRVVELFRGRDYLDLWFLSILYIFSMTITIFILKNLNEDSNFTWMDSKIPIFLAILCFTLLIPYTRRLLEYLKPSTSIEKFAKKINKTNLIKAFIEEDETKIEEKDPLQPIVDIIYNAIQRKDLETVRNGLKAIVSRTISTMDSFSNSEMRKGDGVLVEVVSHLTNICKFSIDVGDWNSVRLVTEAIKKIGIKAAELGFEKTINMIDHFANNVIMRDPRTYRDSILLIGEIGKSASENKKIYTIIGILNRLESLGNKFINKGRKLELDFVATKIKEICEKVPRDIDKDGKASRTDILNIAISNLKNLKREAQNRNIDASHIDWCIYEIEKIKH